MPLKSLDDLFVHFLRDIYYAERQILKALPRMARKADSERPLQNEPGDRRMSDQG